MENPMLGASWDIASRWNSEKSSKQHGKFPFLFQLDITLHSERSPTLVIMAPVALVSLFAMEVTCRHCPG